MVVRLSALVILPFDCILVIAGALVVLLALALGAVGLTFLLHFPTVMGARAGSLGEPTALFCSTIADSLR